MRGEFCQRCNTTFTLSILGDSSNIFIPIFQLAGGTMITAIVTRGP